jgi:hypothetical protein
MLCAAILLEYEVRCAVAPTLQTGTAGSQDELRCIAIHGTEGVVGGAEGEARSFAPLRMTCKKSTAKSGCVTMRGRRKGLWRGENMWRSFLGECFW